VLTRIIRIRIKTIFFIVSSLPSNGLILVPRSGTWLIKRAASGTFQSCCGFVHSYLPYVIARYVPARGSRRICGNALIS
jgi:hypothetical protein